MRGIRLPSPTPRLVQGKRPTMWYAIEPEGETNERLPNLVIDECDMRPLEWALWNMTKRKGGHPSTCLPIDATQLQRLDCVGIDTCSALSVSSESEDFPFLDEPRAAKESISLRGIGENNRQ